MAPRQELPGGWGDETTTTTQPGGTAAVQPGSFQVPPAPNQPGQAPLTSAWGRTHTERAYLQQTYYLDQTTGTVVPLDVRASMWRQQYAQTGDADLADILDMYVQWSGTGDVTSEIAGEGSVFGMPVKGVLKPAEKAHTVAWWLERMRTADEARISKLQSDLYEAGYFAPDVYKNRDNLQDGVYDALTQDAFTRLLKDGAMSDDVALEDLLRQRKEQIDKAGGIEAWLQLTGQVEEPPPFVATVTNPLDLENAARDISTELTGREITGVDAGGYQGQEIAAQRAAYEAQVNDTDATVTTPPSVGTYVEEQLREENAPEIDAWNYVNNANYLLAAVGL